MHSANHNPNPDPKPLILTLSLSLNLKCLKVAKLKKVYSLLFI